MTQRLQMITLAALVLSALLLSGCGSSQPMTSSPRPSSPSPSQSDASTAPVADGSPIQAGALSDAVVKAGTDWGTYDYRTIRKQGWAFLNDLTTSYRNAYTLPAQQYVQSVIDEQAVATAKVLSAGLVSQTDTKAVVNVSIQQTLNGSATRPTFELQMTLLRQPNGAWQVDQASPANGGAN